jgi:hypothetical protein
LNLSGFLEIAGKEGISDKGIVPDEQYIMGV